MPAAIKPIPPGLGFDKVTEAVTTEYRALLDLVRQAVAEKVRGTVGLSDYYVDIQGVWPDRVVVCLKGRLYNYPYTLTADNAVQLGDGTEVVVNYQPVRESLANLGAQLREAADGSGDIECTVIRAGISLNGVLYTDALLQASVPLFEGVRVFSKPDSVHSAGGGKDVANLHGGIYGVRYEAGAQADTGRLVGRFKPIDPADPVVVKMTEAVKRGMAGLFGLSIDADARIKKIKRDGKPVREALAFVKVHSVDLIVEPGAGGGLDRLTEALDATDPLSHEQPGESMLTKIQLIAAAAMLAATGTPFRLTEANTEGELFAGLATLCAARGVSMDKVLAAAVQADADVQIKKLLEAAPTAAAAGTQRVAEGAGQGADAPITRAELATHQARLHAVTVLASSTLPQVAKDKLRTDLLARERLTEAQVDQAITAEREYLAKMTESGRPTGGMPRIEVGDRSETIQAMFDAFFDPTHKNHRDVRSIKECYIEVTGDKYVTGDVDRARLAEAVSTGTFADVLGNSITRRMQMAYRDAVAWDAWRNVVSVVPVGDFRTQERTEMGGFPNLSTVAEAAAYTAIADPTDDKATYAVVKRGNIIEVSFETIKNDDVGALRRLPVNLGRAAKRTLYAFVYNFFVANAATTYDSVALYHASHNNLLTAALDAAQYAAHRLLMMKQPGRDTSNRMGIGPSMLLVPMDLEETAVNLFRKNTNNDKTFVQSLTPTIIPVATWTDVTDWVTLADPLDIPVLEIGFLDGNEEPTLLTQDDPQSGKVFTNDVITYKIRHTYGGNILVDGHKGTTKAVVVG